MLQHLINAKTFFTAEFSSYIPSLATEYIYIGLSSILRFFLFSFNKV